MAEYCEYMWFDSARGHNNAALARSIYEERGKLDKRDKQLAINIVRAILRHRPDVGETEIHIFTYQDISFIWPFFFELFENICKKECFY